MATAAGPTLSVVIPTYRRPQLLEQCLASLRQQKRSAADFEVIVVDDASGPETVAVLEQAAGLATNLRWVSQPHNRGPAAARNRGVELAEGELLLFMDDDIVASPALVESHIALHAEKPDTYGVVGLVEWLPALHVTPFMRWVEAFPLQFGFATMTEGLQGDPTGAFYTCNLSMKRSLFRAAGGFDERFPFAAYEDTELAIRLIKQGFELDYRRAPLAWNSRPMTLDEFCGRMSKVAQSALVFREAYPEVDPIIQDLVESRYSNIGLKLLALLARISPRFLGRDPRSAYYHERVRRAYQSGLATGRPTSK